MRPMQLFGQDHARNVCIMLCKILKLQVLYILTIWQIQGRMDAQVVQGEVHRKAWGWGVEGGGGGMWVGGHGGGDMWAGNVWGWGGQWPH